MARWFATLALLFDSPSGNLGGHLAGQGPFPRVSIPNTADIHLSQDLGRFVAGLTTLATVHATDPTGLVKPGSWYGASAAPFTQPFYDAVYASIQAVVPGHPHTGVAAAP